MEPPWFPFLSFGYDVSTAESRGIQETMVKIGSLFKDTWYSKDMDTCCIMNMIRTNSPCLLKLFLWKIWRKKNSRPRQLCLYHMTQTLFECIVDNLPDSVADLFTQVHSLENFNQKTQVPWSDWWWELELTSHVCLWASGRVEAP